MSNGTIENEKNKKAVVRVENVNTPVRIVSLLISMYNVSISYILKLSSSINTRSVEKKSMNTPGFLLIIYFTSFIKNQVELFLN